VLLEHGRQADLRLKKHGDVLVLVNAFGGEGRWGEHEGVKEVIL
jgi:hypothetical protein